MQFHFKNFKKRFSAFKFSPKLWDKPARTALGPFLRLWSTQTFSALGSSMTSFALVIWAYEQSGSALSTALLAFGAMYAVIAFDLTTFVVAFLTLLFGIRMVYDFFLPGLLLDALERRSGEVLVQWIREICDRKMLTVNMLGCHDGIPLLDLKGLLPEERIQSLIDTVVSRGGYVKDLHGAKNVYYQVNATYYSALGEDDKKCFWHGQYSFSCRVNRRFGIWICLPVVMIMLPSKGRVPVGIKKSTART